MEIRSFLAFELPADIKKTVKKVSEEVRQSGLNARWVKAENIHLTVIFLGRNAGDFIKPPSGQAVLVGLVVVFTVAGLVYFLPFFRKLFSKKLWPMVKRAGHGLTQVATDPAKAVMLFGGAFDLLDGVVARSHGIATRFGAFLDSTLDRVVDMALLLGIAMHYVFEGEPGRVLLAGYVLATSVLVSYAQARAELVLPSFRVGLFERGERILVLAAGALSGFLVAALWIVAIGSTATVIQRFTRAHREMSRIDASEHRGLGENT